MDALFRITDAGLHRAGQHDGQGEGPRRPQIITSTRISCPVRSEAVIPVDSPTVAKAEMVSNMILSNDCDSVSISRNIASISTMVLTMMMARSGSLSGVTGCGRRR